MPLPNAYVTLLYSPSYLAGALTLANSLHDQHCNSGKLVVLIPKAATEIFTPHQLHLLSTVYDQIVEVELLNSSSIADLHNLDLLLKRPELLKTLTKIQLFQYAGKFDTIVYLDSDLLVLQNLDHLFDEGISEHQILASADSGWPDIFNTGLFVVKPSLQTYKDLVKIIDESTTKETSFDGADQGLLNEFYQPFGRFNPRRLRSWKPLSFLYNVTPTGQYQYNPAYKRFAKDIKVLHFIGTSKPWSTKVSYYDIDHAGPDPSKDGEYNGDAYALTKHWWKLFYRHYGKDADIKSVVYNNEDLNSFSNDFKFPKYDPVKNFEALSLDDKDHEDNAGSLEEDDDNDVCSTREGSQSIIDYMFRDAAPAQRRFGPEPTF